MDYEKKYKEALVKLQEALAPTEDGCKISGLTRDCLENIFPELKESEDERIRKWCISHFNACINVIKDNDEYKEYLSNKVIAWLEKQGKEEYALKSFSDKDVHKFMQYIEKQAKAYEFNLPNRGYDIYAFAKDILHWLEKQGENKKLDADKVIEWLKITINKRAENYGVYKETRLILPYNSIEDLIKDFKEDFGL